MSWNIIKSLLKINIFSVNTIRLNKKPKIKKTNVFQTKIDKNLLIRFKNDINYKRILNCSI